MSYVRASLTLSLTLATAAAIVVAVVAQLLVLRALHIDPMLLAHPVIVLGDYAFHAFDTMLLANPVIVLDSY
ncbi:hypothetical protein [Phytohabitans houttuyneae]|uniref:Uncharacterized protein n=1 Tax=Phytohabitans houttuyneae TaxID=1076126 RepID=A0A6V8K1H3_9ACTN|nr:hypothetical protein [Phytohabitans houttuyneae]GFJ77544.1 hypothetical protein Phou_017240 [Phytohabitans houttuyneae]